MLGGTSKCGGAGPGGSGKGEKRGGGGGKFQFIGLMRGLVGIILVRSPWSLPPNCTVRRYLACTFIR